MRLDVQFHWRNQGYRSFDDFLGTLSSMKRKIWACRTFVSFQP